MWVSIQCSAALVHTQFESGLMKAKIKNIPVYPKLTPPPPPPPPGILVKADVEQNLDHQMKIESYVFA